MRLQDLKDDLASWALIVSDENDLLNETPALAVARRVADLYNDDGTLTSEGIAVAARDLRKDDTLWQQAQAVLFSLARYLFSKEE